MAQNTGGTGRSIASRGNKTPPDGSSNMDRGTWDNKIEFFLSCLGYAIGYSNVWRFPYLCYKNGGAVFLISYYTLNFCAALPLLFMEFAIGQYTSLGPFQLFRKLSPFSSGIGFGVLILCFFTAVYNNMIAAWCFFYLFASFSSQLPWTTCDNYFNSKECYSPITAASCKNLTLHHFNQTCGTMQEYCNYVQLDVYNLTHCNHPFDGPILPDKMISKVSSTEEYFKYRVLGVKDKSWENMGELRWELVGCQALGWAIIACSLINGIKSMGKVVYFTCTLPFLVLTVLLAKGVNLEGSYQGLEFYILKPNITRLSDSEVWSDAALQTFFSNAIAFGTIITLASYNKFNNNCMRDAVLVNILNSSTSVYAGLAIFSVLGFLANELGVNVDEVVSAGSGLVFVVYPTALALLPIPQLWSALFFIMLLMIGIGTQISSMETIASAIYDDYEFLRQKKGIVSCTICFVAFLCGLTMCLEGGIFMFELFFWYSAGLGLISLAFSQLISVQFIYGYRRLLGNIREMGIHIPLMMEYYWIITWTITSPLFILSIGFFYIYYYAPISWGSYLFPNDIQTLGWSLGLFPVMFVPVGIIIALNRYGWRNIFKTSPDFCPATVRNERTAFMDETQMGPQISE